MKKEWILKARAGNTGRSRSRTGSGASARTKTNLHPVLTTIQGARGTFQAIRWQSLDEPDNADNKAPSYEQQEKIQARFVGEVSANVLSYMKNYSVNKFRTEYLATIKRENDAKLMVDSTRASGSEEQIKKAEKEYRAARAKKSQLKAAADNRGIDLVGFLKYVLDFHRRKQEAANRNAPEITPENTENAPPDALPTVVEVDGRLEMTAEGRAVMTADAWKTLADDEEEAFNNAVIYALPSDMRDVERATRENMEWQNGEYTGEVSIGLNGEAVPEGKGEWRQEVGEIAREYSGTWAAGQWQGEGELTTSYLLAPDRTGKRAARIRSEYVGGFKQNLFHGVGTLTEYDENGEVSRKYEGAFNNGVMSGNGVLSYPSGIERGRFIDGMLTGQGSIENFETGETQEGLFSRGQLNGIGRVLHGDGSMYEGTFKEGVKHGKFTYTAEDGTQSKKFFIEGEEVSQQDYQQRFGVNTQETLRAAGYTLRHFEEETVVSHFSGIDLPELHSVVKSAIGEYGETMRASVSLAAGSTGANLNVEMMFGSGRVSREFTRNSTTGHLDVYHAYFKLPENLQGGGAGKKIMAEMLRQYKRMGVNRVNVTAALDGGGYTWALYGFHNQLDGRNVYEQFLNPTSDRLGQSGGDKRVTQAKLRKFIDDIGEEKYRALVKFCQSWPTNKPFPMHVIANQFGKSGEAGKNFLRGTAWSGTIDMSDRSHVEQWENYVNPEKLAERARKRRDEMAERRAQVEAAKSARPSRGRRRNIVEGL